MSLLVLLHLMQSEICKNPQNISEFSFQNTFDILVSSFEYRKYVSISLVSGFFVTEDK